MSKADKNKNEQSNKEEQRSTASYSVPICSPGTQIGQFRIDQEIGRGGMGVVYLAHDSKLDRQVAIKSIPLVLADNTKVKSRFRREAKLLASLDHPDIATIYDIIEGDKGISYLVLEYIPGDTLADCITRGPLPPKEVLSLSGQIASAFASAHEHGIVHRDLKPANIKITKEQRIKVLDFGIAKVVGSQASNAYTTVTEPGQLIGTPAYMSPEQARGKPADERSDIWSFGCVLYEMLTGKPPFEDETASDTLVGILEREPDWNALPQATPANVKVLIRRCLEKDPQKRLQHMGDVALEIRETVNLPDVVPPMTVTSSTVTQPATMRRQIPIAVIISVLITLTVYQFLQNLFRPPPAQTLGTISLSIPLEPEEKPGLISTGRTPLLLSPDGRLLVLGDATDNNKRLCVRWMDSLEVKSIPGTENAFDPFFSPDGQWLAFFTQDALDKSSLWKLRISQNGRKILLTEGQYAFQGGSWSDDNLIVFYSSNKNNPQLGTLFQISANGGIPEPLAKEQRWSSKEYPRSLPGGKAFICGDWKNTYLFSRETRESKVLIHNALSAQYSPTGHLIFEREKELFAVAFDVDTLEVTLPEFLVIDNILTQDYRHKPYFGVSHNGILAYVPVPSELPSLVWVNREGNPKSVEGATNRDYQTPRLSPNETKLAVSIWENKSRQVWEYDLNRNVYTQLTFDQICNFLPCWMLPDARRIAFNRNLGVDYKHQLFWVDPDDAGKLESIGPMKIHHNRFIYSCSPDGKYFVCEERGPESIGSWILPLEDDGKPGEPSLFLSSEYEAKSLKFHPTDGHCIAYSSVITGASEIYIKEFLWGNLGEGWVKRVSSEGGTQPCWSRDGKRLFYRSAKGMMEVTVDFKLDGTIDVSKSQVLFEDSIYGTWRHYTSYDVKSDGQFLMIKDSPPTTINVIINFSEELKRLAPTRKK